MATSLTTTYAGEAAMDYFQAAFLTINSLTNGSLTVKQNIKYKQVVKRGIVSGALQGATCDFTDSSTVTIDERILTLKRFDASVELCKNDFVADWEIVKSTSAWTSLPGATLSDFVITSLLGQTMAALETMIWQGVAGANAFAGFETLFLADATVVDIALPVAVTAANVIEKLGLVKAGMSTAVKSQPDVELVVSHNVFEAYIDALGGFGAAGLGANGVDAKGTTFYNGQALTFGGIPVRVANGMSDNTIVGTYVRNLWFGTDLLGDMTEVRTKDMTETDLSDNFRFKAMFGAAVQYGQGSDVVLYQA